MVRYISKLFLIIYIFIQQACLISEDISDLYENLDEPNKIVLHGFLEESTGFDLNVGHSISIGEEYTTGDNFLINHAIIYAYHETTCIDTLERYANGKYRSSNRHVYKVGEYYDLEVRAEGYESVWARDVNIPSNVHNMKLVSEISEARNFEDSLQLFSIEADRISDNYNDYFYLTDLGDGTLDCGFFPAFYPISDKPDICQSFSNYWTRMMVYSTLCNNSLQYSEQFRLSYINCHNGSETIPSTLTIQFGAIQKEFFDYLNHFENAASSSDYLPREPSLSKTWVEGGYGIVVGRSVYTTRLY